MWRLESWALLFEIMIEPITCAFCEKEIDPVASWCISFGNSSVFGYEAVDQVCPDCILDGFEELDRWRQVTISGMDAPHPFDCKGCPDCEGIKK